MADKNKVCVIIGYGPGVGKAIAERWSKEGFSIALVSRTASKLEEAAKTIPNSHPFPCDVTDTVALAACLAAIESQLGEVDHLMYNAGNAIWKKYDEVTQAEMELAMKINVYSLLAATQIVCPKMEARGDGFVCITGATASLRAIPFTSAFASAKAAQRALAQSIARQLWQKKVHVCLAIIDGQIGVETDKHISPASIANEYWHLATQAPDAYTFQAHIQTINSDMSIL